MPTAQYSVRFPTASVEKHIEKFLKGVSKPDQARIKAAMDSLSEVPRPEGKKTKMLRPPVKVFKFLAQYRLRQGAYRILYDVDDAQRIVWIYDIRRRSEKTYR